MTPAGDADLLRPQRRLRARFEDFRRALDRRDRAAQLLALRDFEERLRRWTRREEEVLVPVLTPADLPGRDSRRELRLEYVQLRELTRYLLEMLSGSPAMGDVLGLVENLGRRLAAHEEQMEAVYYPAAADRLSPEDLRRLREEAPPD
ncbi:MAG TPA: hemerythrin domain-containing protein [Thermoanaerobaculia bacterium]|nr:hemerythrin domain-containing protein [Thermoanaerobaculia bacterium]